MFASGLVAVPIRWTKSCVTSVIRLLLLAIYSIAYMEMLNASYIGSDRILPIKMQQMSFQLSPGNVAGVIPKILNLISPRP